MCRTCDEGRTTPAIVRPLDVNARLCTATDVFAICYAMMVMITVVPHGSPPPMVNSMPEYVLPFATGPAWLNRKPDLSGDMDLQSSTQTCLDLPRLASSCLLSWPRLAYIVDLSQLQSASPTNCSKGSAAAHLSIGPRGRARPRHARPGQARPCQATLDPLFGAKSLGCPVQRFG